MIWRIPQPKPAPYLPHSHTHNFCRGHDKSGLALRFPRIKAIRRDKTPDESDTLPPAMSLL